MYMYERYETGLLVGKSVLKHERVFTAIACWYAILQLTWLYIILNMN